jgi:hypothetical protein
MGGGEADKRKDKKKASKIYAFYSCLHAINFFILPS